MPDDDERESWPSATDVDAVVAEFDGDPRAAIRALLLDLDALARDYASDVSRGYVRNAVPWGPPRATRQR